MVTAGVRSPPEANIFSLFYSVQTSSGAHPASNPIDSGGSFPGIKRPGREADHSPSSSAEVKNGGTIPPLLRTSSWCGTQLIKLRDNFTLYLSKVNKKFWEELIAYFP
jgi:hypothetical protein